MSTAVRQRRVDDLTLQLKGLIHVRALLETRSAPPEAIDAHSDAIARVRAQLAGVVQADAGRRRDG